MADIRRSQFTGYDSDFFPEIANNVEYLEYETISTGLSTQVCSYGYQRVEGTKHTWIKILEAKALLEVMG